MKENIDDWWEMNGKIKGDRVADSGRESGGKAKKSRGIGGMDLDDSSEEGEDDWSGSGSESENDEDDVDERQGHGPCEMEPETEIYENEIVILVDHNNIGQDPSRMEHDSFENTQHYDRSEEINGANEDIEMRDAFEDGPSQHPQAPYYHQQLTGNRSPTNDQQTSSLKPDFSTKKKARPKQQQSARPKFWLCVSTHLFLFLQILYTGKMILSTSQIFYHWATKALHETLYKY